MQASLKWIPFKWTFIYVERRKHLLLTTEGPSRKHESQGHRADSSCSFWKKTKTPKKQIPWMARKFSQDNLLLVFLSQMPSIWPASNPSSSCSAPTPRTPCHLACETANNETWFLHVGMMWCSNWRGPEGKILPLACPVIKRLKLPPRAHWVKKERHILKDHSST